MEAMETFPSANDAEQKSQDQEKKSADESDKKTIEQNNKLIGSLQAVFERHPNVTDGASWRWAEDSQQAAIDRDFRQILSLNEDPIIGMIGNTRTRGLDVRVSIGTGDTRRMVYSFRVISRGNSRIIDNFRRHATGS